MKKTMTAQDVELLRTYINRSIETDVSIWNQEKRDLKAAADDNDTGAGADHLVNVAYREGAITALRLVSNFLEELMRE